MESKVENTFKRALAAHKEALDIFARNGSEVLAQISDLIVDCFRNGGCLYLCGNGGSAADSQHIAGELVGRFRRTRRPLPAVALTTDPSVLTCIGNDYRYDDIFARQVEALATAKDVLWAFSTSGTSANILAAVDVARENGAQVIAFTGTPANPLEARADVCLCARTAATNVAQEIHQLAYHIICELIDQHFSDGP